MNSGQYFSNIIFLDNPVIEVLQSQANSILLEFDFENSPFQTNEVLFKFKLLIPKDVNGQAIKIRHGYCFNVKDKSVIDTTSIILADFFSTLVLNSINECNKKDIGGEIVLTKSYLFAAVKNGLASRKN